MRINKIFNILIIILIFMMMYFRIFNNNYFNIYNNILCYIGIIIVITSSIYFSFKLRFIQFNIFKMYRVIKSSSRDDLMALFMSMGAKIGVGSIVGVGIAIESSGPGVILWIWIISLLSSILTYIESYLGVKYKHSNKGGVFYYIKDGLKNKNLAILYTVILIFVYVVGFMGIQSNTIIKFTGNIININKYILIIIVSYIVAIIIFNNTKNIINIISGIVPVMCILYLTLCLIIIISDIDKLKDILLLIIRDGLKWDRALIGTIIVGLQRGIFATESGIGTSSIAGNISNSDKINQGLFQVMGVHFISLVIITITGIVIINSNNYLYGDNITNLIFVFGKFYGIIGKILLIITIFLFAISTIISGYYYSIKGLEFIKRNLDEFDYLFMKLLVILIVFLGGIVKSSIIWDIIDDLILFLLFINIYTIFTLRKKIK